MNDIIKKAHKRRCLTKFLTLEEQKMLRSANVNVLFSDSTRERKRAYVDINEIENEIDFQISVLKINYNKKFYSLTHPMILGSVLGLGIERECVGDIIIDDDAYIFLIREMTDFVIENLIKIDKASVKCELIASNEIGLLTNNNYIDENVIVSSMRLDVFVSHFAKLSREQSKEYINLKNVKVNGNITTMIDYIVKIDDIISIHRHGRVILKEIVKKTKKDKFVLLVQKTK